jgi:hypothetical protein
MPVVTGTPNKPTGEVEAPLVLLSGFGKNHFGRFSLLALYDENTGFALCEKKYLLSKFGNYKRPKADDGEGVEGDGLETPVASRVSTRPRSSSAYASGGAASASAGSEGSSEGTSKRRRVGSAKLKDYDSSQALGVDTSAYEVAVEPQEVVPIKRERTNSSKQKQKEAIAAAAAVTSAATVAAQKAADAERAQKEWEEKEDEDENYRAAFFDEDCGEIYEGGWANGRRNGIGICVYMDGNMYEGSWVNGRENGRGQLMTGERKVPYFLNHVIMFRNFFTKLCPRFVHE